MSNQVTSRLGRVELESFRLLKVLGEGYFGTAYLAEQLGTERLAVVKIAHPEVVEGPNGERARARFAAEVRAATRVRHPGLCTIYTFGETSDGLPAIAMEYIEGETLWNRFMNLQGRPMDDESLVQLFTQLVAVLKAVHTSGIVHRDITPNNVMLTTDHDGQEQVKLLDFGIAMLAERLSGDSVAGTPGYSAPEQFLGKASVASDLFSVGALLWWAATGHELLEEIEDTTTVITTIRGWEIGPDPRKVCPSVASGLARMVRALLDPSPEFRPTLDEVKETLDAMAVGAPAPRSARVLVIDPTMSLLEPVGSILAPFGIRVVVSADPHRAVRAEGEFAAFLLNGRMTVPHAINVYLHLVRFHPETPTFVVVGDAESMHWDEVPVTARVRLPTGGARLAELGARLRALRPLRRASDGAARGIEYSAPPPSRTSARRLPVPPPPAPPPAASITSVSKLAPSPSRTLGWNVAAPIAAALAAELGSQPPDRTARSEPAATALPAWTALAGEMPELLLELEDALRDGADVEAVCRRIEALASDADAREVVTLAQTLRLLIASEGVDNPLSFVADIESAFARAFRARPHNQQPARSAPPSLRIRNRP